MQGTAQYTTEAVGVPQSDHHVNIRKRTVAVGIGNFMEWFDFAIYGYFVAIIGQTFFPSAAPGVSLLSSFAVFAVGFISRPLGAMILGPLGDRVGRRAILIITVFGMGVTTTLIGLLPGYAAIGVLAPILLIALRFIQGMMVGGEWSSAAVYIVESAPAHRRAMAASIVTGSAGAAFLCGTLIAALMSATLSEDAMNSWGWRVPFVASIVMMVIAMYIRRRLGDTPVYEELQRKRAANAVEKVTARDKMRAFAMTFAFSSVFSLSLYYLITYLNTHLTQTVGLAKPTSLWLCGIALVLYTVLQPVVGYISDRVGRRPLALIGSAGIAIAAYPVFLLINIGSHIAVLSGLVILATLVAITAVMNVVLLVEVFPASIRSSGSAIGHNVAVAILSGPGPFIAAALIQLTKNPNMPAAYLAGVALMSFTILWFMLPETKGRDIVEG